MLFFRLRFGDQQNFSIGVSQLTNPSEFSDFGPEIGMANQRNDLRVWEGELSRYVSLTTLDADTWYNVWILIDNANNYTQIWVNDSGGASAEGADQLSLSGNTAFSFRLAGVADLKMFYIKTGGGQAGMGSPDGPIYLDDIYLESGDGFLNLQNPTSLGPLRITRIEKTGTQVKLQWEPPTVLVSLEFATDLQSWSIEAGPITRGNWSVELPGSDLRGFFRLARIDELE